MIGLPESTALPALDSVSPDGWRSALRAWLHTLPEGWRLPVFEYVMFGRKPSPALRSAIENDLARAVIPAADEDLPRLRNLLSFLTFNCPHECWGSAVAVADWIGRGGIVGQQPAAASTERQAA